MVQHLSLWTSIFQKSQAHNYLNPALQMAPAVFNPDNGERVN
jgi:hypothetical protein